MSASHASARTVGRLGPGLVAACLVVLPGGSTRAAELELEIATGATADFELGPVWLLSPLLSLDVPVSENVDLHFAWGFTYATALDPDAGLDASRVVPGSPFVAVPLRLSEGLVFAPGVSLPVARGVPSDQTDPAYEITTAAVNGGRGLRGRVDEWLWLADEIGFVLPVHYATWVDPFVIELDLALALTIVTRSDDVDRDDDFILQAAGRIAWRIVPNLWLGVRLATTFIPTNTADNAQASITPELRWMFPEAVRGAYLGVRAHFNLDTPYGPSFEAGRIWGMQLVVGLGL